MRVYNIFMINNHFTKLYKNKPRTLYQMLEQINRVNEKDVLFAFKLFEQIALKINKSDIYKYIEKDKNHIKISEDTYILSDITTREITKIIVGKSRIKILTNKKNPKVFKLLQDNSNGLYICNFGENDYFWLDKIILKEEIK